MAQNLRDVIAPSSSSVIAMGGAVPIPLDNGKQSSPPELARGDANDDPMQTHSKLYKEPNMRISRWESPTNHKKRVSGWHSPSEKTFTPQAFSYFPRTMKL